MRVFHKEREFIPAPEGLHHAVCVDVVDLGEVTANFSGEEKTFLAIRLVWQIDKLMSEDGDFPRRFIVAKRYNRSLHEKATLRQHLESWRGQRFSNMDLEVDGVDLEKLIGANCQVQVMHRESAYNGRTSTFANVSAVLPPPPDVPKLAPDGNYVRVKNRDQLQSTTSSKPEAEPSPEEEEQEVPF